MYASRCPECDIELVSDNGGVTWLCPLCNQVPSPEQYVWSKPARLPDTTKARDAATRACELLIALGDDLPEYVELFREIYDFNKELAEMWDQKGGITQ